jgi:hypothetical protein
MQRRISKVLGFAESQIGIFLEQFFDFGYIAGFGCVMNLIAK